MSPASLELFKHIAGALVLVGGLTTAFAGQHHLNEKSYALGAFSFLLSISCLVAAFWIY